MPAGPEARRPRGGGAGCGTGCGGRRPARRIAAATAALTLWALAGASAADRPAAPPRSAPRTAIDWLRAPPPEADGAPTRPRADPAADPATRPATDPAGGEAPDAAPDAAAGAAGGKAGGKAPDKAGGVEVRRFAPPAPDAPGVLGPASGGMSAGFWDGVGVARAAALLTAADRRAAPPTARALFRRIALSAGRPPEGGAAPFLAVRLEALMRRGALPDALALLDAARAAGAAPPEFDAPRRLEIGLLTGEDAEPCAAALAAPPGAVTQAETIHCRIRLGDSQGAALALEIAGALGSIPGPTLALLRAQLDPALAATVEGPRRVADATPLDIALVDSIGAPRPEDFAAAAPVAWLWADMTEAAAPRDRLEAAEELVRSGALRGAALVALYRMYDSAESGGVWGRVEALRAADDAAARARPAAERARAILLADARAAQAGLRAAMAGALAPLIAALPAEAWADAGDADRLTETLLLADAPDAARRAPDMSDPELRALLALRGPKRAQAWPELRRRAEGGARRAALLVAALEALGRAAPPSASPSAEPAPSAGPDGAAGTGPDPEPAPEAEAEAQSAPESEAEAERAPQDDAAPPAPRGAPDGAEAVLGALADLSADRGPTRIGAALAALDAAGLGAQAAAIAVELALDRAP